MNKIFWLATLPALFLAAGCSGDKADDKTAAAPPPVTHYSTTTIQARPVEQIVRLPAVLAAYQEVSIFPKVNGYVKSVLVDWWGDVRQGQWLTGLEAPGRLQAGGEAKEGYARAVSDYTTDKENYQRL